ncbi:hypothetical protein KAR48_13200 [bacterium]|nr:hypothetical protein [bacterium]
MLILACRNQSTNSGIKPGAVQIPTASEDASWIERGIDAIPEADAIFIEWIPADDGLAAAFEIFRNVDGSNFINIYTANSSDTSFIDYAVDVYKRYAYVIVSLDEDRNSGTASDTVSYRLLSKAINLQATKLAVPVFSWVDANQPTQAFYNVRVMDSRTMGQIWNAVIPSTYSADRESVIFNSDNTASINQLEQGVDYLWRIDILGSEANSGSESAWQIVSIQ